MVQGGSHIEINSEGNIKDKNQTVNLNEMMKIRGGNKRS